MYVEESKKGEVKKKNIFGEVLTKQMKPGYKTLTKNYIRKFSNTFVKENFKITNL